MTIDTSTSRLRGWVRLELFAPPVAHRPSDLPLSLDRPELDVQFLAREEFDSFDNSAPWACRILSPADLEASTRSAGLSLDLKCIAREDFDSFDNSAPWAHMPVHPQTGFKSPTSSTGLDSLDLNELVREDLDSFDNFAPWARRIHPPANFEAPTACLSTGLNSLDLNQLARQD
ncbi:hypothetical protein K474DRAFT_1706008 [Panus rudis PR-1116 ss-1]|nr:hypothetical protein K474DRAFT_1706008 [Panus rudis PR-1116 ss-1]